MKHVETFLAEDLKHKYPEFYKKEIGHSGPDGDYYWCLCLLDVDGKPYKLLGSDGGEPEDQVLVRNWSWVKDLVQDYETQVNDLKDDIESRRDLGTFFSTIVKELAELRWSYNNYEFSGFRIDCSDKYGGFYHATITILCECSYSNGETGDSEIIIPYEWFDSNKSAKEIAGLIIEREDKEEKEKRLKYEQSIKDREEKEKLEYLRLKNKYEGKA